MGDIFMFNVAGDKGSVVGFYKSKAGVSLIELKCFVSIFNCWGLSFLATSNLCQRVKLIAWSVSSVIWLRSFFLFKMIGTY